MRSIYFLNRWTAPPVPTPQNVNPVITVSEKPVLTAWKTAVATVEFSCVEDAPIQESLSVDATDHATDVDELSIVETMDGPVMPVINGDV